MVSEIEAMAQIQDILDQLEPKERTRALRWAWDKYAPEILKAEIDTIDAPKKKDSAKKPSKPKDKPKKKGKAVQKAKMDKMLNLKPSGGKKSFTEFAGEKNPPSNHEKNTVAVYYLKKELEIEEVNVDHIFTCYKNAGWRLPPDLALALPVTASRKAWIDTSSLKDISITVHGENLIEHDLPKKADDE